MDWAEGGTPDLQPFAPGVAGVELVPVFDIFLVLFPAEEHLASADDGGEIDEAAFDVFDLDLAAIEFEQQLAGFGHGAHPAIDGLAADVGALSQEHAEAAL